MSCVNVQLCRKTAFSGEHRRMLNSGSMLCKCYDSPVMTSLLSVQANLRCIVASAMYGYATVEVIFCL